MRSKFFLFITLFQSSIVYSAFNYDGGFELSYGLSDQEPFREEIELQNKLRYLIGEKRDVFGLLKQPAHEVIVDSEIRYNNALSSQSKLEFRAIEMGFTYSFNKNNSLFIGDKILVWGRADEINPIDVWNSEDYSEFLTRNKIGRKKARTLLIYNWAHASSQVQAVLAIDDVRNIHTLPGRESPWCNEYCQSFSKTRIAKQLEALGIQASFEDYKTKGLDLGARFTSSWNKLDYGLMFYYGGDHGIYLKKDIITANKINFSYYQGPKLNLGGDFALAMGKFTVFSEVKWQKEKVYNIDSTSQEYVDDEDGLAFHDQLQYVIGIDRTFFGDLYINFQYFKRSLLQDTQDIFRLGGNNLLTLLMRYSFLDDYQVQTNVAIDNDYGDYTYKLEGLYSITDTQKLKLSYANFKASNESSLYAGLNNQDTYLISYNFTY